MCNLATTILTSSLNWLWRMHETNVGANIHGHIINNLRFADDIALIAESEEELQTLVDKVHHSSSTFGLKINVNKTEVQNISKEPKHIHIMIDGKELTQVDNFTYLEGLSAKMDPIHRISNRELEKQWGQSRNSTTYGTQQTSECQQRQNYTEY